MVKSPRIRHSRARKKPVTLDLEAEKTPPAPEEQPDVAVRPEDSAKASETAPELVATAPAEEAAEESGPPAAEVRTEDPGAPGNDGGATAPEDSGAAGDGDEAEAAAPKAAPAAPSAQRSGSGLSLVAAGLIGGVIALAGGAGLQWSGVLPAPGAGDRAAPQPDTAAIESLRSELGALSQAVEAIEPAPDASGDVAEIRTAVDGLRSDIAELKSRPVASGSGDGTVDPATVERVDRLEGQQQTANDAIGSLQGELQSASDKAAAAEAAAKAAGDSATALAGRIAALEETVGQLSQQQQSRLDQPRVARAIAAAALKAAIDRGEPFMSELETYASLTDDPQEIAPLRDLAAKGVPTQAEINTGFNAAADAMVAAGEPMPEDAGLVSRLLASARSLVRVRPVGVVEGDDVPATVARIEAALERGRYRVALDEYETLPEPAKAAGSEFMGKVRARMQADQLVGKTLAGALSAQATGEQQ